MGSYKGPWPGRDNWWRNAYRIAKGVSPPADMSPREVRRLARRAPVPDETRRLAKRRGVRLGPADTNGTAIDKIAAHPRGRGRRRD